METVLYYEPLALQDPAVLSGVLRRRGLRVVQVPRDQAGRSVGALAGLPGFSDGSDGGLPPRTGSWCSAGWPIWTPRWRT